MVRLFLKHDINRYNVPIIENQDINLFYGLHPTRTYTFKGVFSHQIYPKPMLPQERFNTEYPMRSSERLVAGGGDEED